MIGTRLANRYEIVRELGRGGMGVVYLARDPMLDRDVAVKLIPPSVLDAESQERFRREARVVAKLDHPNIVGIHDVGAHEAALFYVMPFVRGRNLREIMSEEKLTLGDILDVSAQLAEAMEYSHAAGVVHRDIKPENVLISRDAGGAARVRVTDFGLAVAHREQRLTASGLVVGTLSYLAPEQITRGEIDHRTDIYSFGTLLYELLTGHTPFAGDTPSLLYLIAHALPARPSELDVQVPADVEAVLMQCLEKERERRPARAREVAEALKRCTARLHGSDALSKPHETTARISVRQAPRMLGRRREFALLQERLNESATQCRFVLIGGSAGIGKTRLVEELERLAAARHIPVLNAAVASMEMALPFGSLCRVIEEYFRIRGSADFSDLAPELVHRFPLLIEISELRNQARAAPREVGDRPSMFDLLARTFIRMAAAQPLVIVLEDLHFGDVTVEAVQQIVTRMAAVPVLIVATYRSDEIDRNHAVSKMIETFRTDRSVTHLVLSPLTLEDHRSLVISILGSNRLDTDVVERTFAAAEGNPHFATELVRTMLESHELVQGSSGAWRLASDAAISAESLPATIHQTIERRLERLSERHRALLSIASVAGRVFEIDHIAQLSEEATPSLDADVDDLLALGYFQEERHGRGDRLAFASGVVRDVLYAAIPRRRRRALHRRLAEQLERRHGANVERVYAQLLYHYARGDVAEKVVEFGLRFARSSLLAFSAGDAIQAMRTVLEFVEDDERVKAEARMVLAEALHLAGKTDEALPEIDSAVRAFDRLGDPVRAAAGAAAAADMAWQRQKLNETRRWVEKGVGLARRAADEKHLTALLSLGALAANLRGDAETAAQYLAEVEQLRPRDTATEGAERHGTLHVAFAYALGQLDPARQSVTWEGEVSALLLDTLTEVDETARIVPRLASSFAAEDGARRFRFQLRDGLQFHDGRPVTADDVRYTFARFLRSTPSFRLLLDTIAGAERYAAGDADSVEGIHVLSPAEIVIELQRPFPSFPAVVSYPALSILPDKTTEIGTDWQHGFSGTGPFRLVRFEPGRRLELEANPLYWRRGLPRVQRLVISLGVSSENIVAGFRDGRFSLAFDLTPADHERLRHDRELGRRYAAAPTLSTCFLAFNVHRGPMRDREVREQVAAAIDIDLLMQRLGTLAIPAAGLVPPGLRAHQPERHERRQPVRSGVLVREPVRAGAFSVFITSLFGIAEEMTRAIEAGGVPVELSIPETIRIADNVSYDLYFGRYYSDYPDPDGFMYGSLHSRYGILGKICGSPEIDRLLEQGRREPKAGLRDEIYRNIEELILREMRLLPLFHPQTYCFARPEVEGFGVRRFFPSIPYEQLSLR